MKMIVTVLAMMVTSLYHCSSMAPPVAVIAPSSSGLQCLLDGVAVPNLEPGGNVSLGESCGDCMCDEGGFVMCTTPDTCPPIKCWDSVDPSPYCCTKCPNGYNCQTPEGNIVLHGNYVIEGDQNCTCSVNENSPENPLAHCVEVPTVPTPQCLLQNGSKLPGVEAPGDTWKSNSGCKRCTCQDSGLVTCRTKTCPETLPCDIPVKTNGVCCPTCPDPLTTCVLDSGIAIKAGKTVELDDGTDCSCTPDEDGNLFTVCVTPDAAALKAEIEKEKKDFQEGKNTLSKTEKRKIRRKINQLKKKLDKVLG